MAKKEEQETKKEKKTKIFNTDDFYRKVGVLLLLLLLVIMIVFGSVMIYLQNRILQKDEVKYLEKDSTKVVFVDKNTQ